MGWIERVCCDRECFDRARYRMHEQWELIWCIVYLFFAVRLRLAVRGETFLCDTGAIGRR